MMEKKTNLNGGNYYGFLITMIFNWLQICFAVSSMQQANVDIYTHALLSSKKFHALPTAELVNLYPPYSGGD
jgi:hypothetical protein